MATRREKDVDSVHVHFSVQICRLGTLLDVKNHVTLPPFSTLGS